MTSVQVVLVAAEVAVAPTVPCHQNIQVTTLRMLMEARAVKMLPAAMLTLVAIQERIQIIILQANAPLIKVLDGSKAAVIMMVVVREAQQAMVDPVVMRANLAVSIMSTYSNIKRGVLPLSLQVTRPM